MSRDWIVCAICERDTVYDHDAEYGDVCPSCAKRIDTRIRASLHRISTAITAAATEVGGPAQRALELIAEGIRLNPRS